MPLTVTLVPGIDDLHEGVLPAGAWVEPLEGLRSGRGATAPSLSLGPHAERIRGEANDELVPPHRRGPRRRELGRGRSAGGPPRLLRVSDVVVPAGGHRVGPRARAVCAKVGHPGLARRRVQLPVDCRRAGQV